VTGAKELLKKRNTNRTDRINHLAELGGVEFNMLEAIFNLRNRPIPGENRPQFRDPIR
jgi:hypothetical protein